MFKNIFFLLIFLFANILITFSQKINKPEMIYINGGSFMMGDDKGEKDERPEHKVFLNSFYLSKYEVTNEQYCVFLNEKGNHIENGEHWLDVDGKYCNIIKENGVFKPKEGYEKLPVQEVSWYGARAYCEWIGGRLPTEAEWEYAAKGGAKKQVYKYSGSNKPQNVAWYASTSGGKPHDVGRKKENQLELYDMTGNAWEWTRNWHGLYDPSDNYNPKGPSNGKYKVIRGGSWASFGTTNLRNTARIVMPPKQSGNVSFRICIEADEDKRQQYKKSDQKKKPVYSGW